MKGGSGEKKNPMATHSRHFFSTVPYVYWVALLANSEALRSGVQLGNLVIICILVHLGFK